MSTTRFRGSAIQPVIFCFGALIAALALAIAFVSCSGSGSLNSTGGMATINVSLTDPPSCAFPNGNLTHVYVSIRSVQAHTSATAGDSDPGWQELVPQLNSTPKQIDLFGAGTNACLLAMLGSNTSLPTGTYQQIRLLLVANDGGGGPVPSANACGGNGFNCVVLHDGTVQELDLSSQANTGLKIPPGQMVGGPLTVSAGQSVDLNIDFNACASLLQEGNGRFRLKPVLTAGQVSTNNTGISGQIINAAAKLPIVGGTVLVALEQLNSAGTDVIFMQAAADSSGNFDFCPLPAGVTFDVVVVAIDGAGNAYNATAVVGVPGGTNLGAIPLNAETGLSTSPATFRGFVTAKTASAGASVDVSVSALQSITVSGAARLITIPAEGASTPLISVQSSSTCPTGAPVNANCAQYTLIEPASNPSVGTLSSGVVSYSAPASGNVLYTIGANASVPLSGGISVCTPPSMTTSQDSTANPLKATAGATTVPKEIDLTGCT